MARDCARDVDSRGTICAAAMERSGMSEMEPFDGAISAQRRSHRNGLCASLFMALAPFGLVPAEVLAADPPRIADAPRHADAPKSARALDAMPLFPAPFVYSPPRTDAQAFSPTEFRLRKPGLVAADVATRDASVFDAPLLRDTSLAQEMSEFKSQDRLRLLTLWQTRASTLSLQAGKHGAPSLQWSSPWMHRDAASRGLFDRLLSVPPRSSGSAVRAGVPRQAGATAKAVELGTPFINN
jgi:hypothetical protein